MTVADLLVDGFDRVQGVVHRVVEGLTREQLGVRIDGKANSICWLVWHLTRVQDDHLADASGIEQLWTADGWAQRFALPLDDLDTGYGHTFEQVGSVQVSSGEHPHRLPRRRPRKDVALRAEAGRRRPGPRGRRLLRPAGDPGLPPHQRALR